MSRGEGEVSSPSPLTGTDLNQPCCPGCPDAIAAQQALQEKQVENEALRAVNAALHTQLVAVLSTLESQPHAAVLGQSVLVAEGEADVLRAAANNTQPAVMAYPDIRIYGTDSSGGQVLLASPSARIHSMEHVQMAETAGETSYVTQVMDSAPERYVYMGMETVPEEERINILFQQVKHLQDVLRGKTAALDHANIMNHNLQTHLAAAKMQNNIMNDKVSSLSDEILELKAKVRQLAPRVAVPQHAGTKRGRFITVSPAVLECKNCHRFFDSEHQAQSECTHHLQHPRKLPDKVREELGLSAKHRFWPCCKTFSVETPLSCSGNQHQLQHVRALA